MIHQIADYLNENRASLGLPPGLQSADLSFFKAGGNPWEKGRINFLVFSKQDAEPLLFIKSMRGKDPDESLRREYHMIQKLAACPELQIHLPLPVQMITLAGHDVMLQKACHGERMLASLTQSPFLLFQQNRIRENFSRSLEFVTKLNTVAQTRITPDEFDHAVLNPFLDFYEDYGCSGSDKVMLSELLEKICRIMGNNPVCTPLHGDYSATNIFIDSGNQIKIIDWETAAENSLPFLDLFYFMSKYVHNLKIRPRNRWQRVQETYFGKSWLSHLIRETVHQYCEKTGLSRELGQAIFPLHFLNKARIKYSMRGKEQTQPWINLFEYSMKNLDALCF